MARRKKRKNTTWIGVIVAVLAFICIGLSNGDFNEVLSSFGLSIDNTEETSDDTSDNSTNVITEALDSELNVYFIDVGQADSILIQANGEYMLIDAGNNEDGSKLVTYFESLGISEFKYIVGTHPHEDHIGGLDDIINNFDVSTIYLPDAITTTATFEDVLDAIDNKNMTYTVPEIGSTFTLGDANFEVLYTGTDTSDLNNTSIVLKMTYGNNSFLFTGDATSKVEEIILEDDIDVDVLKVGHHGSSYSTTDEFLEKVNPTYAIISCGKNNSYGHPSSSTITKLENAGVEIYRTDELGTILVTSDGIDLTITNFETETDG